MTLKLRSEWGARLGECTAIFRPNDVLGCVVHWNGTPVTITPDAQLRADQRFHMDTRGWCDIAYNYAVDQKGDVWVCRGKLLKSSANGSTEANNRWVAIVGLIGTGQVPTPAMIQGFRDAISLVRETYPKATRIATHNDVRPEPTQCPGPHLTTAVRNGDMEPTVEGGDEDMGRVWVIRDRTDTKVYVTDGVSYRHHLTSEALGDLVTLHRESGRKMIYEPTTDVDTANPVQGLLPVRLVDPSYWANLNVPTI